MLIIFHGDFDGEALQVSVAEACIINLSVEVEGHAETKQLTVVLVLGVHHGQYPFYV